MVHVHARADLHACVCGGALTSDSEASPSSLATAPAAAEAPPLSPWTNQLSPPPPRAGAAGRARDDILMGAAGGLHVQLPTPAARRWSHADHRFIHRLGRLARGLARATRRLNMKRAILRCELSRKAPETQQTFVDVGGLYGTDSKELTPVKKTASLVSQIDWAGHLCEGLCSSILAYMDVNNINGPEVSASLI